MSYTPRRGRCAAAGLATLSALAFAAPAVAGSFSTACKNSITPTNSQVDVTEMSADLPASVAPSTSFGLTNIHGVAKIPGSVFAAGYNLGLVHSGDTIPGTIQMVLEGTNTTQASQTTAAVDVSVGPIVIHDPDGTPGTGDETADDASVPFAFPDLTWTSGPDPGAILFRDLPVDPIGPTKGGLLFTASIPTSGAPLTVKFGCNPGTVVAGDPDGRGTPTYVDHADPFATTTIPGVTPPPTYDIPNAFTFGKVKVNKKKGTAKLTVKVPGAGVLRLSKGKVGGKVLRPSKAGKVVFTVKARKAALKKLARKGKVKVKIRVSFTPTGGKKLSKTKTITLVKKKH